MNENGKYLPKNTVSMMETGHGFHEGNSRKPYTGETRPEQGFLRFPLKKHVETVSVSTFPPLKGETGNCGNHICGTCRHYRNGKTILKDLWRGSICTSPQEEPGRTIRTYMDKPITPTCWTPPETREGRLWE